MKVLTASQMREVDRKTIELGIPGIVLMENAGHRVVEVIEAEFSPLGEQRIVILCGKGNNGGDGFVVARQLHTRFEPERLDVVLAGDSEQLQGDAAANYRMLLATGCPVQSKITPEMREATLVIDAVLGTGLSGPARGAALEMIQEMNSGFPRAAVVAVDIPSGLASDTGNLAGESVNADLSVTFTAPKIGHVLPPACDRVGDLYVGAIGSPPSLYEDDPEVLVSLVEPDSFAHLFAPRSPGGHKGTYGHALVLAGSRGKTGAAAMTGMGALRAGAGLVTVASPESAIPVIAGQAAELMTEPLPETENGAVASPAWDTGRLTDLARGKSVLAVGPGLGTDPATVRVVRQIVARIDIPMVVDADGLNALAGQEFSGRGTTILTPHPGEMARLAGIARDTVLDNRLEVARTFATEHEVLLVLKGQRTLIAMPDGRVWVNPTGTPAMATGGTGDVLAGLIAGLVAQFPAELEASVLAAVWLHGRAGELGADALGEQPLIATDLLTYLPEALGECADL